MSADCRLHFDSYSGCCKQDLISSQCLDCTVQLMADSHEKLITNIALHMHLMPDEVCYAQA